MFIILVISLLLCVYARTGIDFSIPLSSSSLTSYFPSPISQKSFLIAHGQFYNNSFNDPIMSTLKTAWSLGVADISLYFYPCLPTSSYSLALGTLTKCTDANTQLHSFLSNLAKYNMYFFNKTAHSSPSAKLDDVYSYATIWNTGSSNITLSTLYINVEDITPNEFFAINTTQNILFLEDLVHYASNLGIDVGIYTTVLDWRNVMNDFMGIKRVYFYPTGQSVSFDNPFRGMKLWTPRYDQLSDFSFYAEFGNWSTPYVKQMTGSSKDMRRLGNARISTNYRPDPVS